VGQFPDGHDFIDTAIIVVQELLFATCSMDLKNKRSYLHKVTDTNKRMALWRRIISKIHQLNFNLWV
jgi:hypothetical protein